MARTLGSYRFQPGNIKYPWETWMTGEIKELKKGSEEQMQLPEDHPDHADFTVRAAHVRTAGYAWTDRHGYRVTISLPEGDDGNLVVIQMLGRKRKKR